MPDGLFAWPLRFNACHERDGKVRGPGRIEPGCERFPRIAARLGVHFVALQNEESP